MGAIQVLFDIQKAGLTISVLPGGLLKVEPKEKITTAIREAIRTGKNELIKFLSNKAVAPSLTLNSAGRTWTPGITFTCACGLSTGWLFNEQPLCPTCLHDLQHGQDQKHGPTNEATQQVICQASEFNGIIVSTHSKHCLQWQDNYCTGCTLYKTH